MCVTFDRSASIYLLTSLLVCEYSLNVLCPDPEVFMSMHKELDNCLKHLYTCIQGGNGIFL
jgi:hypothetical protein